MPLGAQHPATNQQSPAGSGPGLTAHGSRLTAHGSRLTAHGSRLTAHGSRRVCITSSSFASTPLRLRIEMARFLEETSGAGDDRRGCRPRDVDVPSERTAAPRGTTSASDRREPAHPTSPWRPTTDDGRRTTDDGRRTTDDGQDHHGDHSEPVPSRAACRPARFVVRGSGESVFCPATHRPSTAPLSNSGERSTCGPDLAERAKRTRVLGR
ncbi:hypothetical protein DEJ26_15420 [Curtobacterium sp. MCPF17_015]|nr:hypothetical protein DEJ26_15420 [Curtobacterium sp. MCPF17_015]